MREVRHPIDEHEIDELVDGMKRRIGSFLLNQDASTEWMINAVRGMQRFIIEWEKRHGQS